MQQTTDNRTCNRQHATDNRQHATEKHATPGTNVISVGVWLAAIACGRAVGAKVNTKLRGSGVGARVGGVVGTVTGATANAGDALAAGASTSGAVVGGLVMEVGFVGTAVTGLRIGAAVGWSQSGASVNTGTTNGAVGATVASTVGAAVVSTVGVAVGSTVGAAVVITVGSTVGAVVVGAAVVGAAVVGAAVVGAAVVGAVVCTVGAPVTAADEGAAVGAAVTALEGVAVATAASGDPLGLRMGTSVAFGSTGGGAATPWRATRARRAASRKTDAPRCTRSGIPVERAVTRITISSKFILGSAKLASAPTQHYIRTSRCATVWGGRT
jgi:hypothetical protein